MQTFRFETPRLSKNAPTLRADIRAFLAQALAGVPAHRRINSWAAFDAEFSRKLGERGWIGMIWPKQYGGQERSAIERYVLLEELLAAGAPVGAHWIADRQSGPAILRYGSEEQRARYLPSMARGEMYCCIGMSEPGAGSDLAAVKCRATRSADGSWVLNGQKIWTTQAHRCHLIITLMRTADSDPKNRQSGLTQFLVDMKTPGITIRPIVDLVGDAHFNEVFFENVIVGADAVLGEEGNGWAQVTGELSLERSGPERYMSSLALYLELLRVAGPNPSTSLQQIIGKIASEVWTLRQMSLSVAAALAAGVDPAIEAAMVKDLGNSFEQNLPVWLQALGEPGINLGEHTEFAQTLGLLLQTSPSFSLRGGTREILRGIIARALGLR